MRSTETLVDSAQRTVVLIYLWINLTITSNARQIASNQLFSNCLMNYKV